MIFWLLALGLALPAVPAPATQAERADDGAAALSRPASFAGDLATAEAVEPSDARRMRNGMFVYFADAARLTDCRTGRNLPVAMEGDYLRLERAYIDARPAPQAPLLVTVDAVVAERPRMEGDGTEPTLVVARFINVWPGERCDPHRADATLTNTYWRIVTLGDEPVSVAEGRREPHLLLRTEERRFSATVGCNQLIGGYEVNGERLRFGAVATTMMACPPPLDAQERRLAAALEATRTWHGAGQVLELRGDDGKPVALLQAVYLR